MAYTVRTYDVVPGSPARLCAIRQQARVARVTNDGPATVWLADADVAPDRGFRLEAGAEPFLYSQADAELYAVVRAGDAHVTVIEEDNT